MLRDNVIKYIIVFDYIRDFITFPHWSKITFWAMTGDLFEAERGR